LGDATGKPGFDPEAEQQFDVGRLLDHLYAGA
jgi:hypothetical protein